MVVLTRDSIIDRLARVTAVWTTSTGTSTGPDSSRGSSPGARRGADENASRRPDAALAWDAFDNLHEHDGVWATYGLLKTDRAAWTYAPKKRYFAAKQVYRFVRPGWRRVEVALPPRDPKDVYAGWHDPTRHVRLLAFSSPDRQDVTLVGMSRVDATSSSVRMPGLHRRRPGSRSAYYRTTRTEDARLVEQKTPSGGASRPSCPSSIFTLTSTRPCGPLQHLERCTTHEEIRHPGALKGPRSRRRRPAR